MGQGINNTYYPNDGQNLTGYKDGQDTVPALEKLLWVSFSQMGRPISALLMQGLL